MAESHDTVQNSTTGYEDRDYRFLAPGGDYPDLERCTLKFLFFSISLDFIYLLLLFFASQCSSDSDLGNELVHFRDSASSAQKWCMALGTKLRAAVGIFPVAVLGVSSRGLRLKLGFRAALVNHTCLSFT